VLARGTTRHREVAVRTALGASRWRLVREQCTESRLIVIGGAVASYVAFQGLRELMTVDFNLTLPFGEQTTILIRPTLNMPVLTMAVGSLLLSLLVFGLEPAWPSRTWSAIAPKKLECGCRWERQRARSNEWC
jgi:putative ABC transport system permease protein